MSNQEVVGRIREMLAAEVGPALEIDGTAIEVLDFDQGVARLRIGGVCAACPATIMTLMMGLEQELRARIPEIEYLEVAP